VYNLFFIYQKALRLSVFVAKTTKKITNNQKAGKGLSVFKN